MGKINCAALKEYTGNGYRVVNSHLRGGFKIGSETEANHLKAELDKAFENAPRTPKNMTVYRGIDKDIAKQLKVGDTFQDKAFVSTTIKTGGGFKGGAKLEIRVPKGSKAIYVASVSKYKTERELLLNRGAKFKVVAQKPDGTLVLELIS